MLLSDEQQQALQQSLQALTDEERLQLTEQARLQATQQWLLRQQELSAEASQSQVRLQDAQQALEQAQPQLAALLNAQPAEQLRPLWTRQQEQTAALAQTHRRGGSKYSLTGQTAAARRDTSCRQPADGALTGCPSRPQPVA